MNFIDASTVRPTFMSSLAERRVFHYRRSSRWYYYGSQENFLRTITKI